MIRIKKVKVTPEKRIHIEYLKENNDNWDEYSMTSCDRAKDSFYDCLNELRQAVIEICELPESDLNRIVVLGVSFSWARDIMGATIIAQRILLRSNVALNLNTPHKAAEFYTEEGDDKQLLPIWVIDALNDLISECVKYVDGDRAQMSLFAAVSNQ